MKLFKGNFVNWFKRNTTSAMVTFDNLINKWSVVLYGDNGLFFEGQHTFATQKATLQWLVDNGFEFSTYMV